MPSCVGTIRRSLAIACVVLGTCSAAQAQTGAISGTVTNVVTGAPISGVTVWVTRASNPNAGLTSAETNASGFYMTTLPLTPGVYLAYTTKEASPFPNYRGTLYDNIPCVFPSCQLAAGTPIVVGSGTTGGINFALTPLGAIAGVVTDAATHAPVGGVQVMVFNAVGAPVTPIPVTAGTGVFSMGGLTAGTYYARTSTTTHINELYDNIPCDSCDVTTGTPIAVANGTTQTVNFALSPVTFQVVPNSGQPGQANLNLALIGQGTHFVQGLTAADLGAGITVNSTAVTDATHATASVTIASGAALGTRTVFLQTGAETVTLPSGFTVTLDPPPPVLTQVLPNTGQQGQPNLNVVITGAFTHFVQGTTSASLGAGITVNSTTVQSATQATANVSIALGATVGTRTVTVTTGGEVVSLAGGFTVTSSPPTLTGVLPSAGRRGGAATLLVTLTAVSTHFVQGTSVASFGAGVTVNSTTVQSATQAAVSITIPAGAALGARAVTVTTGAEVVALPVGFVVTPFSVTRGDFDGDSRSDVAVFRPSTGTWYVRGVTTATWGGGADIPVVGDYDGDGKVDVGIFRPSTGVWFILLSGSATGSVTLWGGVGDIPAPGDYDGDGRTDVAVFRPSTGVWYVLYSGTGTGSVTTWGGGADIPVARDYDGDGRTDIAVFRPSTGAWFILQSSTASGSVTTWGGGADNPVPADFDGDGKVDIAAFRPSTGVWFILRSSTALGSVTTWGGGGDIPVPGDFDGDGKTDVAVFRPSTGDWFIINSSTGGGAVVTWGGGTDIPALRRP